MRIGGSDINYSDKKRRLKWAQQEMLSYAELSNDFGIIKLELNGLKLTKNNLHFQY